MNAETFDNCTVILLDIAGTVGSLNFVKEVLFEYALKNVESFLKTNWDKTDVQEIVKKMMLRTGEETSEKVESSEEAVKIFEKFSAENSTNEGFKALQGRIYESGYELGELKAHLFDDVKESITNWSKIRKICVYSTGSESAQKQYFANSVAGDLTEHITKYFDQTSAGSKVEADSYAKIAKQLEVTPREVVFLCDNIEELKAAKTAGLVTVLVEREGNAEVSEDDKKDLLVASKFTDVPLTQKRKTTDDKEAASEEEPPAKMIKTQEKEVETVKEKSTEKPSKDAVVEEKMEVDTAATKTVEEKPEPKEEAKTEEKEVPKELAKPAEETKKVEVETKKVEVETKKVEVEMKAEEKKTDVKDVSIAEEAKEVVEAEKPEEVKPVEKEQKPENGVEVAEEATESEENKENKPNGNTEENGLAKDAPETETKTGEKSEAETNGEEGKKLITESPTAETEIKVKKIEEPSSAVSVEV